MNAVWLPTPIGSLGKVVTGSTPATKRLEYYNGHYKLISPADLSDSKCITTSRRTLTRAGISVARTAPKNSILVGCIGTIGKVGMVADDVVGFNQQINAIICDDNHNPDFVYYLLRFNRQLMKNAAVMTTLPILNKSNFEALNLKTPPLEAQNQIAKIMNSAYDSLNAQKKVITKLQELKKSMMHHLFTHGTRNEKTKQTLFGAVPANWEIVPLSSRADVRSGLAKNSKPTNEDSVTLPYLRVANVQDGYLDLGEIKFITVKKQLVEKYSLKLKDVLMTEGGDADKLGRGFIWNGEVDQCLHQNHIFAVRPGEALLPEYLSFLTQSPYAKKYFLSVAHRTTNLASINSTKLKAFPVPLPDIPEQKRIIEALTVLDNKISAEVKKLKKLEMLFDTLLNQLMTGKIEVS